MTTKECWGILKEEYEVCTDDIAYILRKQEERLAYSRHNISVEQVEIVKGELERLGRKRRN